MTYLPILFLAAAAKFIGYLMQSTSLSTICKRRGIPRAWTAWLPELGSLKVGTIAHRYQLAAGSRSGTVLYRIFLILGILRGILLLFILPFLVVTLFVGLSSMDSEYGTFFNSLFPNLDYPTLALVAMFAWFFRDCVLGLPYWILYAVAKYRLYRSCDPSAAVGYLIAGIILPFLSPVFLSILSGKDLGMPTETWFTTDPPDHTMEENL